LERGLDTVGPNGPELAVNGAAPPSVASVETGTSPAIEGSVTTPVAPTEFFKPSAPIPEPPPYAAFVGQVLGLALCLSILAFSAAYNVAHSFWRVSPVAVIAFVLAIILMVRLPGALRRIERPDNASDQKKLAWLSCVFVALFLVTATIVGMAIGTSGKETGQLLADSEARLRIAKTISEARDTAAQTIPAQIEMYKEIEPVVQVYGDVLRRMQVELPVYDEKFPTAHDKTLRSIRSVDLELKRADLLKQQIGVARDIELFDPAAQKSTWRERMQPLLDAETDLDSTRY
jgi:hypothetical protein